MSACLAHTPRLILIAALAKNGVIGQNNALPWHLPEDLKHFKALTLGNPIIMGRKTWDSLGRPLPGRENIVISRNPDFSAPGAILVSSLDDAIDHATAAGHKEIFIIGGGEIFALALPRAHRLELTEIDLEVAGDACFPVLDRALWQESARQSQTSADGLSYAFVTYERVVLSE